MNRVVNQYQGWTSKNFIREYAAAIDRMLTTEELTYITVDGTVVTYMASKKKLDLPRLLL